jgi:hypothetical protein
MPLCHYELITKVGICDSDLINKVDRCPRYIYHS